jgi:hypothetical protein
MGPYQLNKDGQIVHVFRSTTIAPNGKPVHLTRGVVGHAGQVFEDLPEHVKRPIEDGETGDTWTILGTPDSSIDDTDQDVEDVPEDVELASPPVVATRGRRSRSTAGAVEDEE